jgi:hypothetical protein
MSLTVRTVGRAHTGLGAAVRSEHGPRHELLWVQAAQARYLVGPTQGL